MSKVALTAVHLELMFSAIGNFVACTAPNPDHRNGWEPVSIETTRLIARMMANITYTSPSGQKVAVFSTCYADANGQVCFIPSSVITAKSLQCLLDMGMAQLAEKMSPAPDRAAS